MRGIGWYCGLWIMLSWWMAIVVKAGSLPDQEVDHCRRRGDAVGSDGSVVLGTGIDYSTLPVHSSSGIERTADVSKCDSLRRARSAWRSIPRGSFSYGPTSCSLMADVQPSTGGVSGHGTLRGNCGMTTFFTGVRPCAHRSSLGTACSSHFPMGWSYLYGHSAEASRASVDFPGWGIGWAGLRKSRSSFGQRLLCYSNTTVAGDSWPIGACLHESRSHWAGRHLAGGTSRPCRH